VQLNEEGKVADCMTTKGVAYGTACSEQFKVSENLHLRLFLWFQNARLTDY